MEKTDLHHSYLDQIKTFQKNGLSCPENKKHLEKALNQFQNSGLPTHKLDSWKYSKPLNFLPSQLALDKSELKFQTKDIPCPLKECYQIEVKGFEVIIGKEFESIKEKVQIELLNLSNPFEESYNEANLESINFLNLASAEKLLKISVKKDVSLPKPILITYSSVIDSSEHLFNTRVEFSLGENSKCGLIEYFHEGRMNFNSFLSLNCEKNSHLNYSKVLMTQKTHMATILAKQKEGSNLNIFSFSTGSDMSRTRIKTELLGEGAHAEVNGLYALKDKNHSDHYIEMAHLVPRTTSNQLFKGILADESHGAFTGKVYIEREAIEVDANQLNKNLLLSKKAKVDTRPSLEVYADDVKCAHGATTGQLNQDELFYLISRGIKKDKAYSLLIHGFINDAIEKVPTKELKDHLSQFILERFEENI